MKNALYNERFKYLAQYEESICRLAMAQWAKRLIVPVHNWKGANIILLHTFIICKRHRIDTDYQIELRIKLVY